MLGHLQLRAQGGQRAAQLVGRVVEEGLLALGEPVQSIKHAVESRCQRVDLVISDGDRQAVDRLTAPMGPSVGADPLGPEAQRLDGGQGGTDDPPGDGGERKQQQGQPDNDGHRRRPRAGRHRRNVQSPRETRARARHRELLAGQGAPHLVGGQQGGEAIGDQRPGDDPLRGVQHLHDERP